MTARYVGVHLLDAPGQIDRPYDYYVPVSLEGEVRIGSIVGVPFGVANRRSYAVVVEVSDRSMQEKVKPVQAVLPERFSLTEEMLGLCFFLRERTLCTLGEAVRCVLPGAAFSEIEEYYEAIPGHAATEAERYLQEHGRTGRGELMQVCGVPGRELSRLTDAGAIRRTYEIRESRARTEQRLSLSVPAAEILEGLNGGEKQKRALVRSEAQERILRALCAEEAMSRSRLCDLTHTKPAQVAVLVRRGLLTVSEEEVVRDPYADLPRGSDRSEICLSRAQEEAYETLLSLYGKKEACAALLHGVTGSGKTKVMMKLIDRVLSDGKQAIVLVPEIALTPQTVGLFCARYGSRVAVVHSSLSEGERFDAWRRAADGALDLVVGTRSAVFTPLPSLGLIVMDEEHEHTYKSESDPKYHTRDVAAYRCGRSGALLLLCSATPSLESYYRAEQGRYTLVRLRERYGGARLPTVETVDMREELRAGNRSVYSDRLLSALQETLARGEQAILLLNRRGYHTALHCRSCGYVFSCPHCTLPMAYHTDRSGGSLFCHVCGTRLTPPRVCSACGSEHLSYVGFGTQKAESELKALLPEARVLRMDADTTAGRRAYDRLLGEFRMGEADILLGTQMVAKGHDFPRVTLVGVLLADTALYVNDYRASERTFALLTQVIGRAGRADSPGRAIIQTYVPGNETIRLACRQDYEAFYASEIALRRAAMFPPFCDMVLLMLASSYEDELLHAARSLSARMSALARDDYREMPLQIFGPFEASVYKTAGKYRLRFLMKCRYDRRMREYLTRLTEEFFRSAGRHVTLSVDSNPVQA